MERKFYYPMSGLKKTTMFKNFLICYTVNNIIVIWDTFIKKIQFLHSTEKIYLEIFVFKGIIYLQDLDAIDMLLHKTLNFKNELGVKDMNEFKIYRSCQIHPIDTLNQQSRLKQSTFAKVERESAYVTKKVCKTKAFSKIIPLDEYFLIFEEGTLKLVTADNKAKHNIKEFEIENQGIFTDYFVSDNDIYMSTDTGLLLRLKNYDSALRSQSKYLQLEVLLGLHEIIISMCVRENAFFVLFMSNFLFKTIEGKIVRSIDLSQDNHKFYLQNDVIYVIGSSGVIDMFNTDLHHVGQLSFHENVIGINFGENIFIVLENGIIEFSR